MVASASLRFPSPIKAYPKHSLEKDIKGDTSGDYRDALLLVLQGQTDEPSALQLKKLTPQTLSEVVNGQIADADVKELYQAGEG